MTKPIVFSVSGKPKGQPRPRAFTRGKHAAVYDPGTAEGWKGQVALAAREHLPATPLDEPVYLSVVFFMPRPARLCRRKDPDGMIPHGAKPDGDNLLKAVLDALTQIGMWRDDSLVAGHRVLKLYHEKGGRPGAHIIIGPMESWLAPGQCVTWSTP